MRLPKLNKKGITIIELLLTLVIITMILQVVYSIYFVGNKSFNISKETGFAQQEARIATDFINSEIKKAKKVNTTYLDLIDFETQKYYEVTLADNKIYIIDSDFPSKPKRIGSSINSVKFEPIPIYVDDTIVGYESNRIKLTVESKEMEKTIDYSLEITFENGKILTLPNDILPDTVFKKIYYTKYE